MQKITPFLWFDTQAGEAAEFYTSAFPQSKIIGKNVMENTPSGTVEIFTIELMGQEFQMMSAGPLFTFNPSISFHVKCKTAQEVDALWEKLSKDGKVLMELETYPWSERYGWLEDKFGVSWQLFSTAGAQIKQHIVPALMFVGDVCGKAEEAVKLYTSIFPDSAVNSIMRYGKGEEPDNEGTAKFISFTLARQEFAAMDSAHKHEFMFNEAISLLANCTTQEEIDEYWNKLSAHPESEQCGWLKDKFGISWQITPRDMDDMFNGKDPAASDRAMQAMLQMKRLDLAALQKAYDGE